MLRKLKHLIFQTACQSCGMPLFKDEQGGGSEANGTLSDEYCSHCYQQGKFTDSTLTLEQMTAKVKSKMDSMPIPDFMKKKFLAKIATLKRWRR